MAPEEIRDVLEGLLDRRTVCRGRVERDAQADVAVASMPGLPPCRAVRGQMPTQLGDVEVAEADEQRKAHATDEPECLRRVGRHAERRMRLLERPRRHDRVVETMELSLIAEGLALPGLAQNRQRFLEARLALA